MPRPPRSIDPDGFYHIIARGNNKQRIFRDPNDCLRYLRILRKERRRYKVSLFFYAIMPNHVHILLRPNNDQLPSYMHAVHNAYAKYFCRRYKYIGHVWQGRYKSIHIRTEVHLAAVGNYIEMNPVRAGLCADPAEWPYSSYRHHPKIERGALPSK